MKNLTKLLQKEIFPVGLILLLVFFRLIHHPPNFTPLVAVAIMRGYLFKNLNLSFLVLFLSMLLADLFIGFYEHMFFVYLSLFLITFIFFKIAHKTNFKNLFIFGFFGSLIFFLISNFGVWVQGSLYEKNLSGLINCYILAIPFFKNTILSTVIFSYAALYSQYFYVDWKYDFIPESFDIILEAMKH